MPPPPTKFASYNARLLDAPTTTVNNSMAKAAEELKKEASTQEGELETAVTLGWLTAFVDVYPAASRAGCTVALQARCSEIVDPFGWYATSRAPIAGCLRICRLRARGAERPTEYAIKNEILAHFIKNFSQIQLSESNLVIAVGRALKN
ncbi:hypothetical protein HPB52_005147 [Rhipicephalus sanguineus]|uniref:Uncharacterized protein n=1 Tax=Rhipicephalus sanguineus TaxID=34632 RepID=A0A9D4PVK0_RHISA|nr:hypothetical protein HPB52_005147 [Rhipicephalus sanguineus]